MRFSISETVFSENLQDCESLKVELFLIFFKLGGSLANLQRYWNVVSQFCVYFDLRLALDDRRPGFNSLLHTDMIGCFSSSPAMRIHLFKCTNFAGVSFIYLCYRALRLRWSWFYQSESSFYLTTPRRFRFRSNRNLMKFPQLFMWWGQQKIYLQLGPSFHSPSNTQ